MSYSWEMLQQRLRRAWCWLWHRRHWWRTSTISATTCEQCGEVW